MNYPTHPTESRRNAVTLQNRQDNGYSIVQTQTTVYMTDRELLEHKAAEAEKAKRPAGGLPLKHVVII